jgi:hypothetical protein
LFVVFVLVFVGFGSVVGVGFWVGDSPLNVPYVQMRTLFPRHRDRVRGHVHSDQLQNAFVPQAVQERAVVTAKIEVGRSACR